MLVVAAVGGNALLRRGEPASPGAQAENAAIAGFGLAALAREHRLIVTHGNGPQVGLLALESGSSGDFGAFPLDVLGAETQGMIGYLLELALRNELPGRPVMTVLSQVLVDAGDPAFGAPSKPIGPFYDRNEAARLTRERGWSFGLDGERARRLVPSPEPRAILELEGLRALVAAGVLTISAGGGGVPVCRDKSGRLIGLEAVIDKDLTAGLLAKEIGADALLLLTDVPAVQEHWGEPQRRAIRTATPSFLRALQLAPGSMGPKVEAACRFAEATGRSAAVGSLGQASAILAGAAGTRVVPGPAHPTYWEAA